MPREFYNGFPKEVTDEIETDAALSYYSWGQLVQKVRLLQKRIQEKR